MGASAPCCIASDDPKEETDAKLEQEIKGATAEETTNLKDSADAKDSEGEVFGYGSKADQSSYYVAGNYRKMTRIASTVNGINPEDAFTDSRDKYIESMSYETKKGIAATHLFASIWHNFFTAAENKCEYTGEEDKLDILDHILIRGGCCRDLLWEVDFNDIDAAVNTRELNKLHLLHLTKYHSTKESQDNTTCILWLLYARKFDSQDTAKESVADFKDDTTGAKIIKSEYMLNAKFLLNILQEDVRLAGHLSTVIMGRTKRVWNMRVTDSVLYEGYDIKDCDMDFLDIKHGLLTLEKDKNARKAEHDKLKQEAADKKNPKHLGQFKALKSIRLKSQLRVLHDEKKDSDDEDNKDAKDIELPIYPLGFVRMSQLSDVTVNALLIHMSDVIRDPFGDLSFCTWDAMGAAESDMFEIDYDWRSKVRNPAFDIDGIKDCKEMNLKTWGADVEQVKDVITQIGPKYFIYRATKMWGKMKGEGNMDDNVVTALYDLRDSWLSTEKLSEDDKYCREIAGRFVHDYAKKGEFGIRLACLELLNYNSIFQEMMETVENFTKYVTEEIEKVQDDELKQEILDTMKQYKYQI